VEGGREGGGAVADRVYSETNNHNEWVAHTGRGSWRDAGFVYGYSLRKLLFLGMGDGGDTRTNGGDSDITAFANTHTHTHTTPCNWHVPREGRDARERGSSTELIRAWMHTLRALTPHSPPARFLPVIVPLQFSQGNTHTHTHTRWPPNSCSVCDKFTSSGVWKEFCIEDCVCVCVVVCMLGGTFNNSLTFKSQHTAAPAVYLLITQLSHLRRDGVEQ